SHSSQDRRVARDIKNRLDYAGLEVWWDETSLVPGADWVHEIQKAISQADAFVVLVGPESQSAWVRTETAAALSRALENPTFRIIPVLLPGAKSDDLPPLLQSRLGLDLSNSRDVDKSLNTLAETLASETPWSEAESLQRLGDYPGALSAYES